MVMLPVGVFTRKYERAIIYSNAIAAKGMQSFRIFFKDNSVKKYNVNGMMTINVNAFSFDSNPHKKLMEAQISNVSSPLTEPPEFVIASVAKQSFNQLDCFGSFLPRNDVI